eukprot:472025_1
MGNVTHYTKRKTMGSDSDSALQKIKSLNIKSNEPTLKRRAATVPITSTKVDFLDEKSQYDADDNDCIEETLIHSATDRRKAIWESPNKDDNIIKCIGSLEMEYTKNLYQPEKSIGTGTVIHIDRNDICYILTAAHNFYQALRKCLNCNKQTIKSRCSHCNCRQKTQEIKPLQLTKADTIIFKRRCIVKEKIDPVTGNKYTFGDPISQPIPINPNNCYCREIFYRLYKHPKAGYDIGIMTFKCPAEDVDLYSSVCSKIKLDSDSDFCAPNNNVQLFIYGYPADHKFNNQYQMYGMSTSMNGNKFEIEKHAESDKRYIKNIEIDTTAGQSGACVWSYDGKDKNKYRIHAVHTSGRPDKRSTFDGENYGTFLDESHVNWINELMVIDDMKKVQLMQQRQQVEEKLLMNYFQKQQEAILKQQEEILRLNNKLNNMEKRDDWDGTSIRNRQINIRNNIITLVGANANECVDTIFLKKIITKGEYKWKFKIREHREGKTIYFGIWKADRGYYKGYINGYIGEKSGDSYVFDGGKGAHNDIKKDGNKSKWKSYGKKLKKGHIVEMCIDFNSNPHSLSFIIDNETFDDISITDHKWGYRAAISLFQKSDSVELLFE